MKKTKRTGETIEKFSSLLDINQEEINNLRWFRFPVPPKCSPGGEDFLKKSHEWIKAVDQNREEVELLELKTGAIYERAERDLSREDFRRLLRKRHIEPREAEEKINRFRLHRTRAEGVRRIEREVSSC